MAVFYQFMGVLSVGLLSLAALIFAINFFDNKRLRNKNKRLEDLRDAYDEEAREIGFALNISFDVSEYNYYDWRRLTNEFKRLINVEKDYVKASDDLDRAVKSLKTISTLDGDRFASMEAKEVLAKIGQSNGKL